MKKHTNSSNRALIIGGIAISIILIIGTYFTGKIASKDAEKAVRNVSILYLDELAGRQEKVVSSTLDSYISDLDTALDLLTANDLSSIENLQAYQLHMKQLYGLEKFAFVDENGTIYTSLGTRTDIDKYAFDYNELYTPEISLKNAGTDDPKVVIAAPTDSMPFNGHQLLVCFMEINMDTMLNSVSLHDASDNITSCNIYNSDGVPLTDSVLGGLSNDNNIISAFEKATIDNGVTADSIKSDFENGVTNHVTFTYNNVTGNMYYTPIRNTDWIMTYFIKESVISEQIEAISNGIIYRSQIMSLVSALILAGVFIFLIIQTRRASALALEKETSELQQQELEERIALQNELLDQEKLQAQQDNMITALASDYKSVYYYDLDGGNAICYRDDENDSLAKEGENFPFKEKFVDYANNYVAEEYREGFLEFIKPENIRKALESEAIIAYRYLTIKNGIESYEMLRMASVTDTEELKDGRITAVGVGFTDIDTDMRASLAKNQTLSDALKTAEEASKAKTVFLSSMSHEIRTPMNAIIGLDSLALNEPDLSETTKSYLEKIGSSAQHLLSLINDILDMSRIESGRMVLKNEEFAISKLLEQINVIFSQQCHEKNITYDCHTIGQLDDYYIGDNVKLRQVLINILGNAVKFTNDGGKVTFTIEKIAEFSGQSSLRFTISDTGIGMSSDFIPKLFETFSQENPGATNKYGSSGLGMSITKSIIEMMNGNIEVQSTKGVGSTFIVTVTLLNSDRKSISETNGDEIRITPDKMNVLVIDDDPIACDQAKLVLEKEGINAEIAHSGQEALEAIKLHIARRNPFNLIIVDWKMPEMDGIETSKRIREIIGDETAIIILTAYNWDDIYEEATAAGIDSFIAKPLFSGSLIDEFNAALSRKKTETQEEEHKAELKGRRILIAEDMEINAQIMIKMLQMRGIESEHAVNGKVAVEMFQEHPEKYYDAILMDMRMPEMDGLTATKTIRAITDRSDSTSIPIIALTANAFDEDVQKSLQAGLNAHLSKPIQPDVLFDTLQKLIKD